MLDVDRKRTKNEFRFLQIGVVVVFLLLMGRLAHLQLLEGEACREKALENMVRDTPIPAARGIIMDRNGRLLARNRASFTISLLPTEMKNPSGTIAEVARILPLGPTRERELLDELKANPFTPIRLKERLNHVTLARLAEIQGDYPGLYIEVQPMREYSEKQIASHILGYVGEVGAEELESKDAKLYKMGDVIGKDGLEKKYDGYLRGKDGSTRVQIDAEGRMLRHLDEIPPVPGSNLILTLDIDFQKKVESTLGLTLKAIAERNGEKSGGAVVALDCRNGELLAMASLPSFDPNPLVRGMSHKEYQKMIARPESPLLNRAISCDSACGSTFKMITGLAALQEGLLKKDSYFYCPGVYTLVATPFYCFLMSGHGTIDFIDAIAQSCDVVFYRLGMGLGIQKLRDYAAQFGISMPTGVDLPGEVTGLLPDEQWKENRYHEPWYAGDTVNLSIGQGYLLVTPLQLTLVTAAVATNGVVYRPHLLRRVISAGDNKVVYEKAPEVLRQIKINSESFAIMKEGMRKGVTGGTGRAANSPVVAIAGKTGTAENFPSLDNPKGRNHTWFTCFAPYEAPEIVVTVFLQKSGGLGGQDAARLAREVVEGYFKRKQAVVQPSAASSQLPPKR